MVRLIKYLYPKWKVFKYTDPFKNFKSIYFDDKWIFGVNYICDWIFNALIIDVSEEKYWMKIRNCIIFMNNSVQGGQNENF